MWQYHVLLTYFDGAPKRTIYDNLKTLVESLFVDKQRQLNRRFLPLANYYQHEPVACTPAWGWEKGQAVNQLGNVREWLFAPTPRLQDFAEWAQVFGVEKR